jgi:hypothetical protein
MKRPEKAILRKNMVVWGTMASAMRLTDARSGVLLTTVAHVEIASAQEIHRALLIQAFAIAMVMHFQHLVGKKLRITMQVQDIAVTYIANAMIVMTAMTMTKINTLKGLYANQSLAADVVNIIVRKMQNVHLMVAHVVIMPFQNSVKKMQQIIDARLIIGVMVRAAI